MIEIEVGQTWRDKDKRRSQDGTVRTFKVIAIGETCITCQSHTKTFWFNRRRFGSGAAHDSFELVAAIAAIGEKNR